jgi:hypothetical protein
MPSLASWSGRRIAGVWMAWLLLILLALAVSLGVILWQVHQLESKAPTRLPPQSSDFIVSFVGSELAWTVAAILAPPVILTVVWLWRRFGAR